MTLDKIKKLRASTSVGINECKKALTEAKGDYDKALAILKQRGITIVDKKKDRKTSQGLIEAYVHFGGNLGVLVEVKCETDFVARTDIFKKFAKDIAMHIAATAPKYISEDEISEEELQNAANRDEYVKEKCLLKQYFVKDNSQTIEEYLKQVIVQTGENVVIKRFVRFSLGGNDGI